MHRCVAAVASFAVTLETLSSRFWQGRVAVDTNLCIVWSVCVHVLTNGALLAKHWSAWYETQVTWSCQCGPEKLIMLAPKMSGPEGSTHCSLRKRMRTNRQNTRHPHQSDNTWAEEWEKLSILQHFLRCCASLVKMVKMFSFAVC